MRKLRMSELNRMDVESFRESDKIPLIVVLDRVRSLHNVGAIFRTGDAFRIEEIHLCGITEQANHPEIDKTALGATESVPWSSFSTTLESVEALKARNYAVYAVEQTTEREWLDEFEIPSDCDGMAIIMGHEVSGVDEDVLKAVDGCIEIPQLGTKHSLNVSISASIVMWEIFKRLRSQLRK